MPAKKERSNEEKLRQELNDLRSGVASHTHAPRDGSPSFRCTSPYCDDLTESEPMGPPPAYAPTDKYRRD